MAEFAVYNHTDELYPFFRKESLLYLRRWDLNNPVLYGEAYCIITDYCAIFRIIEKTVVGDKFILVTPNTRYGEIEMPINDIKELYLVK